MVIACIITALVLFVLLFISLYKAGDSEDNSEYYIDGYHIYYDRKIVRYNEKQKAL